MRALCFLAGLWTTSLGAKAEELPFPFPVQTILSVPADAPRELLERFVGVRGLALEIRCPPDLGLDDSLIRQLNGPFADLPRRLVVRPPLKSAFMDRLKQVKKLGVVLELGPHPLGPDDQRALNGLGPVHVVRVLPADLSKEAFRQAEEAKHTLTAIALGAQGLSEDRWLWLLQKPRRARRFLLGADVPAAVVYDLTRVSPLAVELQTTRNRLSDELLAVLQDLHGVEIVLAVDGRLTRQDTAAWGRLERFKLKVVVARPEEVTPGLPALLSRLGPR
jgi:hypothetical protein